MSHDKATVVRLSDYRPSAFAIDEIDLTFHLDPAATVVQARYLIRRVAETDGPLILDGVGLKLQSIALNGAPLDSSAYQQEPERLIIAQVPAAFTLETEVIICPEANTEFEGLYVSGRGFFTQCESEGFRRITFSLDRPDVLSKFAVRIEAGIDKYPSLLSNGNLIETGPLPDDRHFAVWRDPFPKPCYLFALVAGEFETIRDEFITMSGRPVGLAIHADPGDSPRAVYAMDALKRSMAWDERVFRREYDLAEFQIVAVRDFNFGAMENKGLNIFNSSRLLADPDTATDADFEDIERVVAHEYFHNWTGNRVTLRDWFQLCLKEGLTVFRDEEFTADQRSRAVKRIKDVKILRESQFSEDAGPLAHPVRPEQYEQITNFYTETVYRKGAEVVRVLKEVVGAANFDRGMDLYFDRWDGHGTTVEQFVKCFEEVSGKDLTAFFRWYTQRGTPRLTARGDYDRETRVYRLTVEQKAGTAANGSDYEPFVIPMRVGFLAEDGAELGARLQGYAGAQREFSLVLENALTTFQFEGVDRAPIPTLLRGFPAPVVLDDGLGHRERLVQMTHDPDAFTRWEAGQGLLVAAILQNDRAGDSDDASLIDQIIRALDQELGRSAQADPALAALMLNIPNLATLIQATTLADVERLHQARNSVRRKVAEALQTRLRSLAQSSEPNDGSFRAVGQRALKNAALELLASLGAAHADLLMKSFTEAQNMTDSMGALKALSEVEGECFDTALTSFLARWQDYPLVVDKWFAIQASAPREDAAARVRGLIEHPLFTVRNPNRARSVYGVFSSTNLRTFHATDGSGYEFAAEGIRAVDALNPMVAARLTRGFESWRRVDEPRQVKARAVLEKLSAADISKNTREVIAQSLQSKG